MCADKLCNQQVVKQQAALQAAIDAIPGKGLVNGTLLPILRNLVGGLVDSLVGPRGALGEAAALVPGCSLTVTPGTGGLAGGAGAGI